MFAQVILPLPLHDAFTYRVPEQWHGQIRPGQRVVVQFGAKKFYAALVLSSPKALPKISKQKRLFSFWTRSQWFCIRILNCGNGWQATTVARWAIFSGLPFRPG